MSLSVKLVSCVCEILNIFNYCLYNYEQDKGNGGEINEARWREAQVRTITRLNQVISTSTNRMEWIEIALGNHEGREVLSNEEFENEEDDNVTLLAGHSPRGGREMVRRRGREILAQKRIERE